MNEKIHLKENIFYDNKIFLNPPSGDKIKGKTNKILDYISFAKIISAYGVIILHTNKFSFDNFKNDKNWILTNLIEQSFYFAVPFFVLCIGATLLDFNEKYGLIEFYKRRIFKVVFPLIGWNILSYYYRVYFIKSMKKEKFNIFKLLNLYFKNEIYGLFYSFHIFIITYMIIPLLAYVEKNKKMMIYFYCFFTLLITNSLIPFLIDLLHAYKIYLFWPYKIDAGYIIYIFSGYIIQNYIFSTFEKILIYIIGLISFLIQLLGTQISSYRHNRTIEFHMGYLQLPTILYCTSFFLFIKENFSLISKKLNKKYINKIGSLTIGPFFLHWPLIEFFQKFPGLIFRMKIFTFYGGSFICIISFILTYILKKIPIVRYLVP